MIVSYWIPVSQFINGYYHLSYVPYSHIEISYDYVEI